MIYLSLKYIIQVLSYLALIILNVVNIKQIDLRRYSYPVLAPLRDHPAVFAKQINLDINVKGFIGIAAVL
jgi:hypothetical protein